METGTDNTIFAAAAPIVLAALVLYAALFYFSHSSRTRDDFPAYAYYNDGWLHASFGRRNVIVGLLAVGTWIALIVLLARTGHDILAATVWAGTMVFVLAAAFITKTIGRTCRTCGGHLMLFRKRRRDAADPPISVSYLMVCDQCKEVRSEVMFLVTGGD
jgi:hypothetical protein